MLEILPIMLCCTAQNFYLLCSNYAQALCLISHVLLTNLQVWTHNKWLSKSLLFKTACDRKDRYTLIEQSGAWLFY